MPKNVALHRDGTVILSAHSKDLQSPDFYKKIGCDVQLGRPKLKISSADCIVVAEKPATPQIIQTLKDLKDIGVGILSNDPNEGEIPLLTLERAFSIYTHQSNRDRFSVSPPQKAPMGVVIRDKSVDQWEIIEEIKPTLIFLSPSIHRLHYSRDCIILVNFLIGSKPRKFRSL